MERQIHHDELRPGGNPLTHDEIAVCLIEGFTSRVPSQMTPKAYVIHYALRKSLLPRVSYREGFTNLQQHLLRALLTRTQFCVVDFR